MNCIKKIIFLIIIIYTPVFSQVVVIDPGHGGTEYGAEGPYYGLLEKDINLQIAYFLESFLIGQVDKIYLTRDGDYNVDLEERVEYANIDYEADLFISIHHNAGAEGDTTTQGTETFYCAFKDSINSENQTFAEYAQNFLLSAFGLNDRGAKDDYTYFGYFLYVLRYTEMPATLTEASFLTEVLEEWIFYWEPYDMYDPYWHSLDEAWALYLTIYFTWLTTSIENPPDVTISGPSEVGIIPGLVSGQEEYAQWTASPVGGDPPYSIQWYIMPLGSQTEPVGTGLTYTIDWDNEFPPGNDFEIWVVVTDSEQGVGISNRISVDLVYPPPPTVEISGPTSIYTDETKQWTADVENGLSPFEYQWYRKNTSAGSWNSVGTSSSYTSSSHTVDFDLKVIVTDDCDSTAADSITVTVSVRPLGVEINGYHLTYAYFDWDNTWWAEVSGGVIPYTYAWSMRVYDDSEEEWSGWESVCSDSIYDLERDDWEYLYDELFADYNLDIGSDIQLKVVVTDNAQESDEDIIDLEVTEPQKKISTKQLPKDFNLEQNYPNPFNPVTTINFQLPKASNVTLVIYNIQGQEVARLVDGYVQSGYHSATWDASSAASGIYIYRLQAGEFSDTKRMLYIK